MDYHTALRRNGLGHYVKTSSRQTINIPYGNVSYSQHYKQTPYRQASTITPSAYNGWEEYNGRWTHSASANKHCWLRAEHKQLDAYAKQVFNHAEALLREYRRRG